MKKLLVIIILSLIASQTFAQLKGTYCNSQIFSSYCLTFKNDKEFDFDYSDCTSFSAGGGIYQLNQKELIFTFNKPKPDQKTCITKIKEQISKSDSVTFTISIFDKTTLEPLVFANTILKNKEGKFIGGKTADINGKSKFSFLTLSDTVTLVIPYVGYQECIIPVVLNKNYEIEIGLTAGPIKWIEPGVSWRWKIKSLNSAGFKTKGKNKMSFRKSD